jgi:F-type H+-transporting ATPase subunit b
MDLLTPDFGLIFWQAITFLIVLFVLGKFAWNPIISSLHEREDSIETALASAEKAKKEMIFLQAENEKLLDEARKERDIILQEAITAANQIKEEAKFDAQKIATKLVDDAKVAINAEKQAALNEVKNQVASLSIEIAEKLLRKNLSTEAEQKDLVNSFVKDVKLN